MKHLNITLSLPSAIEFNGLCDILRNIRDITISFRYLPAEQLTAGYSLPSNTNLLVCDPTSLSASEVSQLRRNSPGVKIALLYHTSLPAATVKVYDTAFSIYDSESNIQQAVTSLFATRRAQQSSNELTQREKEIIIGVAKGLSNKEIAVENNVSVNTVMTHRRNIASKLEIHSAAGLTVYALMSNLITLEEIGESKADF